MNEGVSEFAQHPQQGPFLVGQVVSLHGGQGFHLVRCQEAGGLLENPLVGSPNRATAATWSATEGGICVVAKSITVEPCEYPPSTIFVFGQLVTVP